MIRQNALFKDFYLTAEHDSAERKYLYVMGIKQPLKFLNGGRALSSVLSHCGATLQHGPMSILWLGEIRVWSHDCLDGNRGGSSGKGPRMTEPESEGTMCRDPRRTTIHYYRSSD